MNNAETLATGLIQGRVQHNDRMDEDRNRVILEATNQLNSKDVDLAHAIIASIRSSSRTGAA